MKHTFSSVLVDLAIKDSNVLVLSGDHGYELFNQLRESRANQFINMGVAEQNMVGVAAGLARVGFRPIVYGLSAFVPIRVLEQIKLDVCHDGLPVIFVGDGAGFVYSQLGTSHQSTEDIAATRSIPGIIILSPGDRFEFERCFALAYQAKLPVYLRLGKADRGDVHSKALTFNLGDMIELKKSTSENGNKLTKKGYLLPVHPLDTGSIRRSPKRAVLTRDKKKSARVVWLRGKKKHAHMHSTHTRTRT